MRKYNEDEILKEMSDYISNTYRGHYSVGNVQTLDLIDSVGDAEAFCRSNVLKYASRYDRKGTARKDIIKIIHYGMKDKRRDSDLKYYNRLIRDANDYKENLFDNELWDNWKG